MNMFLKTQLTCFTKGTHSFAAFTNDDESCHCKATKGVSKMSLHVSYTGTMKQHYVSNLCEETF